jgi:hypothetical protein
MEKKIILSAIFVSFLLIAPLTVIAGPGAIDSYEEETSNIIELSPEEVSQLFDALENIDSKRIRKAVDEAFTNSLTTNNLGVSVLDLTLLQDELQGSLGSIKAKSVGITSGNTYPLAKIELSNGGSVFSPAGTGGLGWFYRPVPGVTGDLGFCIFSGITEKIMRETMAVKKMSGALLETLEEGDEISMGVFIGLYGFKLEDSGPRMIMKGIVTSAETTQGEGEHIKDVWIGGWVTNENGNPIRNANVICYESPYSPLCLDGWYCFNVYTVEDGTEHYTFKANRWPFYGDDSKEIDVSPGDTITDLNFVLPRATPQSYPQNY